MNDTTLGDIRPRPLASVCPYGPAREGATVDGTGSETPGNRRSGPEGYMSSAAIAFVINARAAAPWTASAASPAKAAPYIVISRG